MCSACGIPTHVLELDPPAQQGGTGPRAIPPAGPARFAALRNRDCRPYLFGAGLAMMADTVPDGTVPHDTGAAGEDTGVASYSVNPVAVACARQLIDSRQYVLRSDWGSVQPAARDQNAYLKTHSFDEYARWHLGLTDGATDQTKARYAFVIGDFRRLHRMGLVACLYRAAEWRHRSVLAAAYELLEYLDDKAG